MPTQRNDEVSHMSFVCVVYAMKTALALPAQRDYRWDLAA